MKILFAAMFILLVSSCISLNQFVAVPVGEEPGKTSERFVYSLPQTVLEIKLNFTKTTYLPGPYKQWSEKYLGISEYIRQEKVEWALTGAKIRSFSEPDPGQYYSVNQLRGRFQGSSYLEMSSKGLVINPMGMLSKNSVIPVDEKQFPGIFDVSLKQNHKEKVDTLFKTVIRDTSFVTIPILTKQKTAKTLEQKAEEAANLVIKIRKRRLKLIDGEYNVFPEGIAFEKALDELDKTEKEYISLFTGKIHTEYFSKSFFVVPAGQNEQVKLTKFSRDNGLLPVESDLGKLVTIDLSVAGNLSTGLNPDNSKNKNILYYRVPATCTLQIKEEERLLFDGRVSVFQAGEILPLPVNKTGFRK